LSTIVVERKEWEQLIQDTDRLVSNYEKLLSKIRDLETDKRRLEEKLSASQTQQQELQQKLSSIEEQMDIAVKETAIMKDLHSTVSRLLKDSESET